MANSISKSQKWPNYGWYMMLIIPIVGTFLFNLYPLAGTLTQSFCNANSKFIGVVNYQILAQDGLFKQSVANTLFMGVLGVAFNIPISFMLANMLNNIRTGKNIFKVIYLLPLITSAVSVAMIFKFVFSPDPHSIANFSLSLLGIKPLGWFNSVATSRQTVVAMALWKGIGYNVIVFFAGLQTVPTELYEAAIIDGANEWQKWIHITIPSMRNAFIFVFITSCITVLKRFADVYALGTESANPANSILTIMLYIYRESFSTLFSKNLGLASAASIVLFLIIMLITILNLVITRDKNKSTSKQKYIKN